MMSLTVGRQGERARFIGQSNQLPSNQRRWYKTLPSQMMKSSNWILTHINDTVDDSLAARSTFLYWFFSLFIENGSASHTHRGRPKTKKRANVSAMTSMRRQTDTAIGRSNKMVERRREHQPKDCNWSTWSAEISRSNCTATKLISRAATGASDSRHLISNGPSEKMLSQLRLLLAHRSFSSRPRGDVIGRLTFSRALTGLNNNNNNNNNNNILIIIIKIII